MRRGSNLNPSCPCTAMYTEGSSGSGAHSTAIPLYISELFSVYCYFFVDTQLQIGLLLTYRAAAPSGKREEPVRPEVLHQRGQQYQYFAGILASAPYRFNSEVLMTEGGKPGQLRTSRERRRSPPDADRGEVSLLSDYGRNRMRCTRQLVSSPTSSSFGLRQSISLTVPNSLSCLPAVPNLPSTVPSSSRR
jgi:hypothetical protein